MQRDFKLQSLVPLIKTSTRSAFYPAAPDDFVVVDGQVQPSLIKTAELHGVVAAFAANVDRIDSLAAGLPLLVHMGLHTGKHGTWAWATGASTVTHTDVHTGKLVEGIVARGWETVGEYLEKWPNLKAGVEEAIRHISGWASLEEDAVDAWLASIITSTWTAFEILATDLWEASINCHPHGLADVQGSGKEGKSIGLIRLQEYGYDIKNKMGTILRDKLGQRGLEHIRKCYRLAFVKNGSRINAILDQPCLDQLQIVRNVIVHHAGKADDKFVRSVRDRNIARFVAITKGAPVLLDGEILRDAIEPVIKVCIDLIHAVDGWLTTH